MHGSIKVMCEVVELPLFETEITSISFYYVFQSFSSSFQTELTPGKFLNGLHFILEIMCSPLPWIASETCFCERLIWPAFNIYLHCFCQFTFNKSLDDWCSLSRKGTTEWYSNTDIQYCTVNILYSMYWGSCPTLYRLWTITHRLSADTLLRNVYGKVRGTVMSTNYSTKSTEF